jgi:hypothetical protein
MIRPAFPDPWGAAFYDISDHSPFMPWYSWEPKLQKSAAISNIFCHCWYHSNTSDGRVMAYSDAIRLLVLRAGFPFSFVAGTVRKWASKWQPKPGYGSFSPCEAEHALLLYRS